jgi:hypothetical protein
MNPAEDPEATGPRGRTSAPPSGEGGERAHPTGGTR